MSKQEIDVTIGTLFLVAPIENPYNWFDILERSSSKIQPRSELKNDAGNGSRDHALLY